jgi:spore maturation protein SpmB
MSIKFVRLEPAGESIALTTEPKITQELFNRMMVRISGALAPIGVDRSPLLNSINLRLHEGRLLFSSNAPESAARAIEQLILRAQEDLAAQADTTQGVESQQTDTDIDGLARAFGIPKK